MQTKILDTTIRDGSYAIDFKFTCKEVKDLVQKSEKIGLEFIEIGHGQGLSASSPERGISLQTDEEYMQAAKSVVQHAKLGVFCIPDIAKLDDLCTAKQLGMDFVRIGVAPTKMSSALTYIQSARELGLYVFVNYMKSYTVSPQKLALASETARKAGADCVYIVDSAGSMDSNDISRYYKEIRSISDVKIGFHGHNNLGLAVSNTVNCVHQGFDFVDCSFQGLGRSLGNASLEQVIMTLTKQGVVAEYDIPRVLEYGYAGLRNIAHDKLVNPLEYMCGFAGFHSSFLKDIYRCCCEVQVDPLRLIMAYCKQNQESMDYQILKSIAANLPLDKDDNPYSFADYFSERFYD